MQDQLEKNLAHLVSIPSISGNTEACREIIQFMASELEALGLVIHHTTDTSHPWLIAATKPTKTPDILLVAHLDVVPGPDSLFSMQKKGGRLYGRGVYDMKLAASCYLELFKQHTTKVRELNIGLLFTTDEEIGGYSMIDVLATGLKPGAAFIPDGGDNWSIEKRAKGVFSVEIIARGKSAHGSRPWEGENALHALLDISHILRSKYPSTQPSDATLSVNLLRSGEAANQVPEHASMMIDFRSFEQQEMEDFKLLVAELARIHDLQAVPIAVGSPLLFDQTDPKVQSFLEALKHQTGREPSYCESYGASDARYFAEHNIPCIVIEPRGGGRHSNEEWCDVADLEKYYRLIEAWILSYAPTPIISQETKQILQS